jgi:hypothetical protein
MRRNAMSEFEKLYTVGDIAKMASLTPRTIRNYLKDGSLQGQKIGGQWRFTMENIKQMFSNSGFSGEMSRKNRQQVLNFLGGNNVDVQSRIQVCTVVDCYCENQKAGQQLYQKLVTVINTKDDGIPTRFDYKFSEKQNRARFTLFGNQDYIIKTLQLL